MGANDGIVSTASLLVGVLAAGMDRPAMLLTGLAGLTAVAFSMAAGEYVSVSAQSDTENADLARERQALEDDPEYELTELAEGLEARGVSPELALRVAHEMTEHDALDAHAREELGLTELANSNPLEAAFASALAFAVGGVVPLAGAVIAPQGTGVTLIAVITMLALILLGGTGALLGGAPIGRGIARVMFWGGLAMGVTFLVGLLFDAAI
ncbi:VIT1/CCC1 transporter family protein [Thalassovita aquimarina]|uniref:VIT1/CCC1 transporter family protein n=1 Tax=Thalassovita aquimarina TaxID=2785917 RepID=UPI003568152B